jgi:hypothetical protein
MSRSLLIMAVALSGLAGCGNPDESTNGLQPSMIQLEIHRKTYNYRIPWSTQRTRTSKEGLAINGKRILTTADDMNGHTLVRVQKNADGRWWNAKVKWISYPANLAILEVTDSTFWEDVPEARLSDRVPKEGDVQVYRWNNGRVEKWSAEINRVSVNAGQMSYVQHLQLNLDSKIDNAGWAEIVVSKGEVIGITTSSSDDELKVMPAALVRRVLEARDREEYTGFGFFDFTWQPGVNDATMAYFSRPEGKEGVLITRAGIRTGDDGGLKPRDILLSVDGFSITREGLYDDPEFGRLPLANLATRAHFAGESIEMEIWREGKMETISYTLPEVAYEQEQVPDSVFDRDPEYVIAGGLLFMPVNGPYLAIFGRKLPFMMDYYSNEDVEPDREGLVVLAAVLPDPYTLGYDAVGGSLVDTVNGKEIGSLEDLVEALDNPPDGYHEVGFFPEYSISRIVLDAYQLDAATARVLQRYSIPAARVIHGSTMDEVPEIKPLATIQP